MQYRTLGKTGLKVSLLGMGCMRLPFIGGDGNNGVDKEAAIELIQLAADSGINYFDTAFGYHGRESEAILGEALAERQKRGEVIFATKQPWWEMPDGDSIRRNLENTLEKLRTDYIDVYMLHRIIPEAWENIQNEGIFDFFDKFKREGLIKHIGFSYHGEYATFTDVVKKYPWEMCMVQQNMLDIDAEVTQAGLDCAGNAGLGVTIMEPLRGGGLSYAPAPVKPIYERYEKEHNITRTPTEWAFRHLTNSVHVSSVVSGMNNAAQLKENVKMFSQPTMLPFCLTDAEKDTISAAREAYKSIISIPCTTCNYCIPCPQGVQIPGIFVNYNDFRMFEHSQQPRRSYMFTSRAGGDATKCNNCGKCVKKCPQKINIPQDLQAAHEVLKGWHE
ncbi:MAG: aldo/keto reductase [Defluviitaleaceae bacterium]|nr:aldo/keto reductase [Defluviitaleaceae bacterium]